MFEKLLFSSGNQVSPATIARIERKLDLILKHLGIEDDPCAALPQEVLIALERGNKIEAIKLYREATGAGLAEAKDAVEAAER